MPTSATTTDLGRLSLEDLLREREIKKIEASKIRLAIKIGGEKNHAMYRALRREIARISTAITHKRRTA